jgi:hypothetical protein
MKRFPKSKGRIQALNICIMQYTAIESHGYDSFTWPWITYGSDARR